MAAPLLASGSSLSLDFVVLPLGFCHWGFAMGFFHRGFIFRVPTEVLIPYQLRLRVALHLFSISNFCLCILILYSSSSFSSLLISQLWYLPYYTTIKLHTSILRLGWGCKVCPLQFATPRRQAGRDIHAAISHLLYPPYHKTIKLFTSILRLGSQWQNPNGKTPMAKLMAKPWWQNPDGKTPMAKPQWWNSNEESPMVKPQWRNLWIQGWRRTAPNWGSPDDKMPMAKPIHWKNALQITLHGIPGQPSPPVYTILYYHSVVVAC